MDSLKKEIQDFFKLVCEFTFSQMQKKNYTDLKNNRTQPFIILGQLECKDPVNFYHKTETCSLYLPKDYTPQDKIDAIINIISSIVTVTNELPVKDKIKVQESFVKVAKYIQDVNKLPVKSPYVDKHSI